MLVTETTTARMKRATATLIIAAAVLAGSPARASHITITGPPTQLHLAVGTLGPTIDTVTFNVPPGQQGSGTPVAGSQSILVEMAVRRGGFIIIAFLQANSSTPLTSGPNSIPMTEISWTSANGVIPSGTFNGSASQTVLVLIAFAGTRRREDTLTFSYANTTAPPAGTYQSTVVYTATVL
ncbi:MAG: hypothetical protein ACE5H7_13880 [Acidiferrobacterales bacterium]